MDEKLTTPWVAFDATVPEFTDVADEILQSLNIPASNLKYVSSSEFRIERFSFLWGGKRYMLSYSFGQDKRLKLESLFLKNNKKPQTSIFMFDGLFDFCGEEVEYNIISYDYADPLSENMAFLGINFSNFLETHSELCSQNIKCRTLKELVDDLESSCSRWSEIKIHPRFDWLWAFVQRIFPQLKKIPKSLSSKNTICHGNFTVDSVIVAGDLCKIIDWKHCVNADSVFDVFYFAISLGLDFEQSLSLYEKIGGNLSKSKLQPIYWFVFKVFVVKNLVDFCNWAFSKQKSDGAILFSITEKIKNALSCVKDEEDIFSDKEKSNIQKMLDNTFFEERNETI